MTRRSATHMALWLLLAITIWISLHVGPGDESDPVMGRHFFELRGLRIAAAFLAGAGLAVGGVLVQGLFRNPLASPSIIGTTAGATLGGQLALLLWQGLSGLSLLKHLAPELILPMGCMAGAVVALSLLFALHRNDGDTVMLLLVGFLLSALFLALSGLVTSIAQERWELARAMIAYALGDVSGAGPRHVALGFPLVVSGVIAAYLWGRPLDLMLSGEEEAASLGVDVVTVRRYCILWVAALTAAAVSVGGNLGFVGLVVPHALRPLLGVSHRRLVFGSALLGGTFVVACDALTRGLGTKSEIPLGVVTGLLGGPMFLSLLLRSRNELSHG